MSSNVPPPLLLNMLVAWAAESGLDDPGTLRNGGSWRVEGPLPVALHWGARPRIVLAPWTLELEPEDDAEALDLLAAALFGRARLWRFSYGETTAGFRLEIDCGGRWVEAGGRRPPRRLFRRPTASVHVNERPAPASVRWGTPGTLPRAPWVGMLALSGTDVGTLPIDGELDLHPFRPKEVKGVVLAYIDACRAKGITQLRLVHGKGIGNLRRTVHALLERHEAVVDYRLGGMGEGSWGATVVTLHPSD